MVEVHEVADNIYMIDNQLFSLPRWGSVYLLNETKKALIESGPATSVPAVLEGIKETGIRPEDIDYIIVTHVHLDHAGGVGTLVKYMPQAQVVVHYKGERHLVNPEKLVAGAIEARGSKVMAMHGEVLPVERHRIRAVKEGETIKLSEKQTLKFMDTPGHAPHELCIFETRNAGVFTGDAVAVYVGECDVLLPFHPPPQFDLELCLKTLDRLKGLSARQIYYSHFGAGVQVNEHIERVKKQLMEWDNIARKAAGEGSFSDLRARLISRACTEIEPMKSFPPLAPLYDYLVRDHIPLCADGHIKYYKEKLNLI